MQNLYVVTNRVVNLSSVARLKDSISHQFWAALRLAWKTARSGRQQLGSGLFSAGNCGVIVTGNGKTANRLIALHWPNGAL